MDLRDKSKLRQDDPKKQGNDIYYCWEEIFVALSNQRWDFVFECPMYLLVDLYLEGNEVLLSQCCSEIVSGKPSNLTSSIGSIDLLVSMDQLTDDDWQTCAFHVLMKYSPLAQRTMNQYRSEIVQLLALHIDLPLVTTDILFSPFLSPRPSSQISRSIASF